MILIDKGCGFSKKVVLFVCENWDLELKISYQETMNFNKQERKRPLDMPKRLIERRERRRERERKVEGEI